MKINVDTTSPLPIYAQVMDQIRRGIAVGTLGPGDQLPTVRQLAVDLRINPNTVARVYKELEREGLIATRQGSGTFVAAEQPIVSDEQRREELKRVARSAIAEAVMLGFTQSELVQEILETREQEE